MIELLSNSSKGVCEWSITSMDELEKINKDSMSPTSTVTLVEDSGMRIFILNGDRTKWVEL